MIVTQLNLGLNNIDLFSVVEQFSMWGVGIVLTVLVGLGVWWLYNVTTYNIQVELLRQIGEPYLDEDGKKKINYRSEVKSGKIYQKKLKSGGFKEYFRIKGANWDYLNYFRNDDFYNRKTSNLFDFKKIGIKLLIDQQKGLVPLTLSNPGFMVGGTTLNEVIGAVTDSLHEREHLFGQDFWTKYGAMLTIASLMAFFVIGMIFMIKYQDVFWKNAMNGLQRTIQAVKEVSSQNLQ